MKKAVKFALILSVAALLVGGFAIIENHANNQQHFALDPGGGRPTG
jgi:hypothetical protein